METGQLYGVWQSIAIKVNGEAGLYLNKNSLSMKMGESGTATSLGSRGMAGTDKEILRLMLL